MRDYFKNKCCKLKEHYCSKDYSTIRMESYRCNDDNHLHIHIFNYSLLLLATNLGHGIGMRVIVSEINILGY